MNRKTTILVGAAAALTAAPALAAPATSPAEPAVPAASSYSDLLQPIPNAVERLKIADMQEEAAPAPRLIQAQYNSHHHHHHHHNRGWYTSHGYVFLNGFWVLRPAQSPSPPPPPQFLYPPHY